MMLRGVRRVKGWIRPVDKRDRSPSSRIGTATIEGREDSSAFVYDCSLDEIAVASA